MGHQGREDETQPVSTKIQHARYSRRQNVVGLARQSFNTREVMEAANFELADCWDEGEPPGGIQEWPVCVALNQ